MTPFTISEAMSLMRQRVGDLDHVAGFVLDDLRKKVAELRGQTQSENELQLVALKFLCETYQNEQLGGRVFVADTLITELEELIEAEKH